MAGRFGGGLFQIDMDKLLGVLHSMEQRRPLTSEERKVTLENLVGYDWQNSREHQEWLDTAPALEIAQWCWELLLTDGENRGR